MKSETIIDFERLPPLPLVQDCIPIEPVGSEASEANKNRQKPVTELLVNPAVVHGQCHRTPAEETTEVAEETALVATSTGLDECTLVSTKDNEAGWLFS